MSRSRMLSLTVLAAVTTAMLCGSLEVHSKTTITFSFWGPDETRVINERLAARFMEEHPDIEVIPLHIPGNYEDRIATMAAGGTAPDVMMFQDEPFPHWVRRGLFEDLSERIERDPKLSIEDFLPQTTEYFRYEGRQFGLPGEGGPITWFYNKKLFAEAGIAEPEKNWTVEQFLDIARRLTQDHNGDGVPEVYGAGITEVWVYAIPFFWSFGGKFLDVDLDDRTVAVARTNEPGFIEALRFMVDARVNHNVHGGNFLNRTQAMMINGPWALPQAYAALDSDEWELAHIPIGPTGLRATRHTFGTWAIWSGSTNKEAAYEFVSWIFNYEGPDAAEVRRAMPAKLSAAIDYVVQPQTPQNEEIFLEIMHEYAWMQPTHGLWLEVEQIFNRYLAQALSGQIAPETAAEQMQNEANQLLKELWPRAWRETFDRTGSLPPDAAEVFAADRQLRGGF